MSDWTAGQMLVGLATVLGGGAFVAAYFGGLLNALLPSPARLAGLVRQWGLPLPAGERFVVLVADLQGDENERTHTRHVAAALDPYRGLDVVAIGPGPEWGIGSRDAFEGKARALLAKRRGDVLITGDVATPGKGIRLRILAGDRSVGVQRGTSEGRRAGEYTLTDTGLPLDFDRNFDAVLVALVAASVAPATERQGHYLVDVLKPVANRLKRLCGDLSTGVGADQRGRLWYFLGLAAYVLGEQAGESAWLEESVAAFCAALEATTREQDSLQWAIIHKDLGTALASLGEREDGTKSLERAVEAYRAALAVFTPGRNPWPWATTQNNLSNALYRLGEREDGTELLQQAVEACDAALEVFTRERFPLDWAMTQSNLANVLCTLGEREDASGPLLRAIEVCRAALEVRVRELVPLQWATTQNNLGNALRARGEREDDIERLRQAAEAFRAALEVRPRDRLPLDWAMTQSNLGSALGALGDREDGTESLEQAIAAFRAALEVRTRERMPRQWAITQRKLARAEALLAERGGGEAGRSE